MSLSNFRVSTRLAAGFGIVILLLVGVMALGIDRLSGFLGTFGEKEWRIIVRRETVLCRHVMPPHAVTAFQYAASEV